MDKSCKESHEAGALPSFPAEGIEVIQVDAYFA